MYSIRAGQYTTMLTVSIRAKQIGVEGAREGRQARDGGKEARRNGKATKYTATCHNNTVHTTSKASTQCKGWRHWRGYKCYI